MKIEVRLTDLRCKPYRAHPTDAGADLVSLDSKIIYPKDQHMFDTGVSIAIPDGYVGMIFNRSSQGKIRVQIPNGTGIIDSSYRGNLKVILVNNGIAPYEVTAFTTRIAQLVIVPIVLAEFDSVVCVDDYWNNTSRGEGGFGSTG